jgi:hypothetical protein
MFSALFIVGLLGSSAAWAATLSGTVFFKGTAPQPERIKMSTDAYCLGAEKGAPVHHQELTVNGNGTLADVFVVVKDYQGPIPPPSTEPVVFTQHVCHYSPHVFGIQVGQPLKIVNQDPTLHNVHSLAKANPIFHVGMPTKGLAVEKKFTMPERMVRIKCDVHGWMNAYAGVVEHPFFAVSGTDGSFQIANLPPGEYTLEAWQEKLGTKTEKVKVTEGGAGSKVSFTYGTGT